MRLLASLRVIEMAEMMKQVNNFHAAQFRAVLAALLVLGAAVGTTEALTPAIFVFGDSLVDPGNNDYQPNPIVPKANFYPYGESFFIPPTGRFSNGRLVPDFLATFLGLPFAPPFKQPSINPFRFSQGANFGSAGAGILDSTNANLGVIPLSTQLAQFQTVAGLNPLGSLFPPLSPFLPAPFGSSTINNALYVFFIGSNDLIVYFNNATLQATTPINVYLQTIATALFTQIQIAINAGARKIFIAGLGPIGCTPQAALVFTSLGGSASGPNLPCLTQVNQVAQAFNNILLTYVNSFNPNGAVKVVYGNSYDPTLNLIQNGPAQGFTSGLTACCGVGPFNGVAVNAVGLCGRGTYNLCPITQLPSYIFFDAFHPTERVYQIGANNFWFGNTTLAYPINLLKLSLS